MTYPQQPAPGYPYPPQQPGANPYQHPQYYPQQGAPQGYAPPPQFQQPAPQVPLADGSLDAFYKQPSVAGGPSWSFKDKQPGHTFDGFVERTVTDADVQQQTDPVNGQPVFYRDGRAKFVLKVPMIVQATPEFPEGKATWYVGGQARDELARAMAEAGATGAPEKGARIQVTLLGRKPSRRPGLNPSNQLGVQYLRPAGAPAAPPPPVQQPTVPEQQAMQQQAYAQAAQQPSAYVQAVAQENPQWNQPAAAQVIPPGGYQSGYPVNEPAPQGGQMVQPDHAYVQPGPWPTQQPVQQAPQQAQPQPPVQVNGQQFAQGLNPEQQDLFNQLANQAR
jgi:hypothetical protein